MKTLLTCVLTTLCLSLTACNTWQGVKQDAKEVGSAAGKGIEKAGEKIQDIAK